MARGKAHNPETRAAVIAALLSGYTTAEITRRQKVSRGLVLAWAKQIPAEMWNLEIATQNQRLLQQARDHVAKLESDAIERLFLAGWSFGRIAKETGFSFQVLVLRFGHIYERLAAGGKIARSRVGSLTPEMIGCRRLRLRISSQLATAVNKGGGKVFEILGYSLASLQKHLESQFQPGMTWANYGEWHIDHRTPASWFTYANVQDDQFRQCWALENLQPKWAAENISKGNRYAD